ncbi:N-acetylmuramoyl-L-alanine amidase [Amycolatopsis sp. PS_44_ISF1]|uniref:N-acetylmuramoyl-L-alanine amidase n=1 Tax=Amycolatopsis sp. PS_44_ISF1 TaxID=2974917 RepID=UPI0028DFFA4C|nr:N-acetylmuramoyl-L-alanine amidase [Amycolatopsis sp. PS_44_ISF1]MDT8912254.1 N-acetylmuramoyl-L-alanine amidase [Amycolatopsis sp. PS_44_ISF1]
MRVLRRGDSGVDVADVNTMLHALGLLRAASDPTAATAFTVETEHAILAFQQQRGLRADGLVERATYLALRGAQYHLGSRPLTFVFSAPANGDDVLALQQQLNGLGYDPGRCDGVFGSRTLNALRRFQRDGGLDPDGVCGAETVRALHRLVRVPAAGGRPLLLREQEKLRKSGRRLRGKRIVIDPGHGGPDTGAVHGHTTEAELMWDLARRLEGHMVAVGMDALLSRGANNSPSVARRTKLANDADADLLLSLHCAHHSSPHARGVASFHFGNGDVTTTTAGELLARLVQRELVARTAQPDCGTHPKTWDILRHCRCTALHLELGYLSNPADRALLEDSTFRDQVAEGILVAVKRLYVLDAMDQPMTGTFTVDDILRHESA